MIVSCYSILLILLSSPWKLALFMTYINTHYKLSGKRFQFLRRQLLLQLEIKHTHPLWNPLTELCLVSKPYSSTELNNWKVLKTYEGHLFCRFTTLSNTFQYNYQPPDLQLRSSSALVDLEQYYKKRIELGNMLSSRTKFLLRLAPLIKNKIWI